MAAPPAKLSDIRALDWVERDEFYAARGAWQEWVRCDAALSMTARCVAIEISDRMSFDKNGAWPSQPFIAARLGCKERSIRSAIGELIDRGWFLARRGGFEARDGAERKSGLRASYTYIMTAAPVILRAVLSEEQERVALFKEERRDRPYRQKVAGLLIDAKPAENCRPYRQKVAALTGEKLPGSPAESCRVIYSEILSSEPLHGTSEDKRLGETVQDESQGSPSLPSECPSTVMPDEADDEMAAREEVIAQLAGGDLRLGRRLAEFVPEKAMSHLVSRVLVEGIVGTADAIKTMARAARDAAAREADAAENPSQLMGQS